MNLIVRRKFFYFSCIYFLVFSLTHCSAEEDQVENNDIIDQEALHDNQGGSSPYTASLDIEELKKIALGLTFENVQSISIKELVDTSNGKILWFKDFYNWELHKLSDKKIKFILSKIANSRHLSAEDINEVVISGEEILKHLSFQQVKSLAPELLSGFCRWNEIDMSIYSPESIKQLSNEQLEEVGVFLNTEQVLSLNNEQILVIFSYKWPAPVPMKSEYIEAMSPERLKSFGDKMFNLPVHLFNYEQFQVLGIDQILRSDREQYFKFSRENLSPEQFAWLTVEQIPLLNTEYRFDDVTYGLFKHLSEEQLKAFTSEQLAEIELFDGLFLFATDQIRFLVEYGTANKNMHTLIELIDDGPNVFKNYERELRNSNLLPKELGKYLRLLEPEQFKYIKEKQLVYALLLTSYLPNLLPAQIYNMPYFVESLQGETVLEKERVFIERTDVIREGIIEKYGTLNPIIHLDRDQIRAIHPDQIPDLNKNQLWVIINKRYDLHSWESKKNKTFIFTPEQFNALTPEQVKYVVEEYRYHYITEEQFNVLSIDQINILLEDSFFQEFWDVEVIEKFTKRRNELLEFGDIKLPVQDSPPEPTLWDLYKEIISNQWQFKERNKDIITRYGGVCAPKYKEEKAREIEFNIVTSDTMDELDICIADNIKYGEETFTEHLLFEGCSNYSFDLLPKKFQEACYQKECLYQVIEKKITAFQNYDKCLTEYHPELRERP